MAHKNTKPVRLPAEFEDMLRRQALQRVRNRVDTKIRTPAEMAKLHLKAPSLKKLDLEVCTLPTKEQLRRKR